MDPACHELAVPNAPDVDRNLDSVLGTVLQGGEFQALLPESLQAHVSITIVEEYLLPTARPPRLRGDTSVLRRGVLAGIRYDFRNAALLTSLPHPRKSWPHPPKLKKSYPSRCNRRKFAVNKPPTPGAVLYFVT
jgi:hypothetical protein